MGRTKRQNIGFFCPAEKYAPDVLSASAGLSPLRGRIGSCRTGWRSFAPGAIRYAVAVCCCGRDEPADRIRERRGFAGDTRYFSY